MGVQTFADVGALRTAVERGEVEGGLVIPADYDGRIRAGDTVPLTYQARLSGAGTAKSGWPIDRLIGFFILAARSKTLRMPELSNCAVRWASQGCMGVGVVGRQLAVGSC